MNHNGDQFEWTREDEMARHVDYFDMEKSKEDSKKHEKERSEHFKKNYPGMDY